MGNRPQTPMNTSNNDVRVYLAIQAAAERSHIEDTMVLDGFDVRTFASAGALWEGFQQKPVRLVITESTFATGLSGLDLARQIRLHYLEPHVHIVMLSALGRLTNIQEGLAAGVDDYLIKPHHLLQLRTRVLVGIKWLNQLDSLVNVEPAMV